MVSMSATQIKAISTLDIANLATADIAALTSTWFSSLNTAQVAALTTNQIVNMETADLAALNATQIAAINTSAIAALTTNEIVSLSASQIGALTSRQAAALGSNQLGAIETADISSLTTAAVAALATNTIDGLTTNQIDAMTMSQASAFTAGQTASMVAGQTLALDTLTSPIILDLDGNGVDTTSLLAAVKFDIDGDGDLDNVGWAGANDGLLVHDVNADGTINDGTELFGEATALADGSKADDGFEALAQHDQNQDGSITAADNIFSALKVWVDANQDGISQADELKTLSEMGITRIDTIAEQTGEWQNGNWVGLEATYETTDGQVHEMADVWFATEEGNVQAVDLTAFEPDSFSPESLARVNLAADGGKATVLTLNADVIHQLGSSPGVDPTTGAAAPVQMRIDGDQYDTVNITGGADHWTMEGSTEIEGTTYDVYNDDSGVQLLVQKDVHTNFI
jgi:hypothetical protein